jgi:hypothetical protein
MRSFIIYVMRMIKSRNKMDRTDRDEKYKQNYSQQTWKTLVSRCRYTGKVNIKIYLLEYDIRVWTVFIWLRTR